MRACALEVGSTQGVSSMAATADPDSLAEDTLVPPEAEEAELVSVPLLGRRTIVTHQRILFTLLGVPSGPSVGGPPVPPETQFPLVVCEAKVDHSGLATCKGTGTIGALLSILTLGAYASFPRVFTWGWVKLPVIVTG